jgi:hypothetical protein
MSEKLRRELIELLYRDIEFSHTAAGHIRFIGGTQNDWHKVMEQG